MPIYADFNRDGVLRRNTAELQAASHRPGAIIVPNFDADSSASGMLQQGIAPVDRDSGQRGPSENDLTEMQVLCLPGAVAAMLSIRENDVSLIRVYDASGAVVLGEGSVNHDNFLHYITASPAPQVFFIEAIRLPGYPDTEDYPLFGAVYFTLQSLDSNGLPLGNAEHAFFTTAPFLLMNNSDEALVMYMCETSGNETSLRDVYEAFGIAWSGGTSGGVQRLQGSRISCTLTIVPESENRGDKWMQDQFEVGYFRGPSHDLPAILHLPRLRNDFQLLRTGANLGSWIANYFNRPNMALLQHLWQPDLVVYNASGQITHISPYAASEIQFLLQRLREAYVFLRRAELFARLGEDILLAGEERNQLADSGVMLWALQQRAQSTLASQGNPNPGEDVEAYGHALDGLQAALQQRWDMIRNDFELQPYPLPPTGPTHIIIKTQSAGHLRFVAQTQGEVIRSYSSVDFSPVNNTPIEQIGELDSRLESLVGSHNYGGNIEVTPSSAAYPFGQIYVGSPELANPKLWAFLANQGYQPIIRADTSWLIVGHIDEILSFAPAQRGGRGGSFVALHASPDLALTILLEARSLFLQGLPAGQRMALDFDETRHHFTYAHRNTERGTHPVTRMLRGKTWLQVGVMDGTPTISPPMLYQEMLTHYRLMVRAHGTPHIDYNADIAFFDAALSIREFLFFGYEQNSAVSRDFLDPRSDAEWVQEEILDSEAEREQNPPVPLAEILENNLPPGITIIPLPVLFDNPFFTGQTIAYLPNMVNMQYVGRHTLVPRPYGPRMKPADAALILRNVLPASLQSYPEISYFTRNELHKTWHWATHIPNIPIFEDDLLHIARMFADGFPMDMEEEEIMRRIRRANPGAFRTETVVLDTGARYQRAMLREEPIKLHIPENTVDLFEAYTYIVLKEMCGLTVHFIDSWNYHITLGEIHCGTNVVRRPPRGRNWWDIRQNIPDEPYAL